MDSRERVVRTIEFSHPDRIPVQSWCLWSTFLKYGSRLDEIVKAYDNDFYIPEYSDNLSGEKFLTRGTMTDAWGCVWLNLQEGATGEVKEFPLTDYSKIAHYKSPKAYLKEGWENVDSSIEKNRDKFILTPWTINIFERMQFLRGTENLLMDLAEDSHEVRLLRDIVYDFYSEWLKLWLERDVDGVIFSDDWGTQNSLIVSPGIFRSFFKPMYKELMSRSKEKGKYVFFHSDGNILGIMDDLLEVGVDAVNCQTAVIGIDILSEKYRGKVTFWGETDRQGILPFGTPAEVYESIKYLKSRLTCNEGGLIGLCAAGAECPLENIRMSFTGWNV